MTLEIGAGTKVFVTGGSGFVGRALLAELRDRGAKVRALARSDASREVVRRLGAQSVAGGLHSEDALRRGCEGCDVVFHVAAFVEDWGTREQFHQVNVVGTHNVIEAARSAGCGTLVHVSTEAVLLGSGPIVRADETRPRSPKPLGLYCETKGLAEQLVQAASDDTLRAVIVRPRFIWGAGDTTLLPALVEATRKKQLRWFGGGRYLTSTCHVRNVVEGMLLAAEVGRGGEIYFLTDGEPVEFRTFVSSMLLTQGIQPPAGGLPRPVAWLIARLCEFLWRRVIPGGRPPLTRSILKLIGEEVTVVDDKARRELGYTGRVTVAEGLAELVSDAPEVAP